MGQQQIFAEMKRARLSQRFMRVCVCVCVCKCVHLFVRPSITVFPPGREPSLRRLEAFHQSQGAGWRAARPPARPPARSPLSLPGAASL